MEEKPEHLNPYDYTPPSDPSSHHTYSEGDVPLIGTTTETESDRDVPFSKKMQLPLDLPPLEDRHKYEKLVQGVDVSSDSSDQDEVKAKTQEKVKKRRKISFPEKLQNVYKAKSKAKTENKDEVSVDSDDSIGSASDLKAEDDPTEVREESKEDLQSEDIQTCGSSAYHAECESMATHEEDYTSRIVRAKRKEQLKAAEEQQQQEEDMIFIGHQYGERPLLADDELDSDCEIQPTTKWDPDKNLTKKESLWIPPSTSFDDTDVFSLAPFRKSRSRKSDHVPYSVTSESYTEPSPLEPAKSLNPFLNEPDFATLVVETETKVVHFDFPSPDSPEQATGLLIDLSSTSPDSIPSTQPVFEESKPARTSISPKLKLKKDKKKDLMKSKYQLFSDNSISDDSPSSFKLQSKSSKGFKSGSVKKTGKSKKTTKTLLEEGFSNMSFEDFPSDEREVIPNSELPFEVLRTPSQENRRSASKKLGNPFS